MKKNISFDMSISEMIDLLNGYLVNQSHYLCLDEGTVKAFHSDGTVASNAVLIPCYSEERMAPNETEIYIYAKSFCDNAWLPPVCLTGVLKNLDFLYKTWGMHKFPVLSKKEKDIVITIFSVIARKIEHKKVYSFLVGWVDNKTLLIKNLLITKSSIEYVNNSKVKKELKLV